MSYLLFNETIPLLMKTLLSVVFRSWFGRFQSLAVEA